MPAIDQNDVIHDSLLGSIQGNILKGHGRDHTANIFVEFHPDHVEQVRAWLGKFAKDTITSAKTQLMETERFKRHKVPGGLFAGVYVSAAGYRYFDIAEAQRPETAGAFSDGMRNAKLMDPVFDEWEPTFREIAIHLMILLGHDDKLALSKEVASLVQEIRLFTAPANLPSNDIRGFLSPKIGIEYGNAIRNANGDGLEHFGYVDGISQPLFFKDEQKKDVKDRVPDNETQAWDPVADIDLVLVPDHLGAQTKGSYFVFRKLEQDVRAFKTAERQLAIALGLSGDDSELAGAMLVGRFEDGTPVTTYGDDGMIGSGNANNFNYEGDATGRKCPFHGHVRKTNPRGSAFGSMADDKKRVMARRGIPYGQRDVSTEFDCAAEQFPHGPGVGLLFQSFQASITDQFEFIQKSWANNADFPGSGTGIDPLIGQGTEAGSRDYVWPDSRAGTGTGTKKASFEAMVTMKGGEYFFAPSIDVLKDFRTRRADPLPKQP